MKRNSHPQRRKGRHHVSARERHELRCSLYFGPVGRKVRNTRDNYSFPRALPKGRGGRLSQQALHEAGYSFASLTDMSQWAELHGWLKENCSTRHGRLYTWFGNVFWFERPEHRQAFMERFSCSSEYEQKFFSR